jgi:hypothetical protein
MDLLTHADSNGGAARGLRMVVASALPEPVTEAAKGCPRQADPGAVSPPPRVTPT